METNQEHFSQSLRDRLKECDKDTLIDIILDLCFIYVSARVDSDSSDDNCVDQCRSDSNAISREVNDFIAKRVNKNIRSVL